ncbi:hypothetical protein BDBG_17504 [Blastomyces gilchristii SLH14081]|uniref:Uncharacterized protein n=2 Tax=Blastomyces TaxID=229219 RepID=A0A179UT85_BLAGS|nr:uncharacterized protein BDBG_17504 [Blastomyces gilchristii SLH14081]EGE84959.1 hypothetical protein BDDG_07904 [Blastomyces dermatitidis ATCC 18188]OAT11335.1 hypothetical protein BDBG_17504 [Blastomyces gilchristii SLH14081]
MGLYANLRSTFCGIRSIVARDSREDGCKCRGCPAPTCLSPLLLNMEVTGQSGILKANLVNRREQCRIRSILTSFWKREYISLTLHGKKRPKRQNLEICGGTSDAAHSSRYFARSGVS